MLSLLRKINRSNSFLALTIAGEKIFQNQASWSLPTQLSPRRLFSHQLKGMLRVPDIPITVNEASIEKDAIGILEVVRPSWIKRGAQIKPKVFTDGLSNKLVGFYIDENPEDVVVVKVYGLNSELLIDHKEEIQTMIKLHEHNCGAQLYATFANGISYEYINGVTLNTESCLLPSVYPLVAKEMAKLHSRFRKLGDPKPSGNEAHCQTKSIKSQMWAKMRTFDELAEEIFATKDDLEEKLAEVGVYSGYGKGAIDELEAIVESHNIPVTFTHNDLLLGNIIFNEKENRVTFIDYEYCMLNYAAFDVANHFLEFAGVTDIDYSRYPNQEFRSNWIAVYLDHYNSECEQPISQELFEKWVSLCIPASHLMWGLWGIVQAKHSNIDFDHVAYAGLRLAESKKLIQELSKQHSFIQNGIN